MSTPEQMLVRAEAVSLGAGLPLTPDGAASLADMLRFAADELATLTRELSEVEERYRLYRLSAVERMQCLTEALATLRGQMETVREAAAPFVRALALMEDTGRSGVRYWADSEIIPSDLTVGDLRRLRTATQGGGDV